MKALTVSQLLSLGLLCRFPRPFDQEISVRFQESGFRYFDSVVRLQVFQGVAVESGTVHFLDERCEKPLSPQ